MIDRTVIDHWHRTTYGEIRSDSSAVRDTEHKNNIEHVIWLVS